MTEGRGNLRVAVPVLLLDEVLPSLKDTELRILLVVLRQTSVVDREREQTWLTHRELCRRTGRASEAVSAAIEGLVGRGLLEVQDEEGVALATPSERQLAVGRRFFRPVVITEPFRFPKTVADKAKTIDISSSNNYSFRFSEEEARSGKIQQALVEEEKARIRQRLSVLNKS